MKQMIIISFIGIAVLVLLNSTLFFAQTITINAGGNQIINWEKTHSAQLKGSVTSADLNVKWTCPQNSDVVFKDASNPITEVTFPRPGYYLLYLSGIGSQQSSVIVNVFKPNSYKERLADLISLMTVDEKIKQLANESDSIPRLGITYYNYWSEALHGILASGATSFPQAVAMGATWDPNLIFRVASTISDEARAINVITVKD